VTSERWQEIVRVYTAALDQPPEARHAYLADLYSHDVELHREVQSLLAADHASPLIDRPLEELVAAVMTEGPADLIGTTIGRYQVTAALGRGGMGEVYRAHDTSPLRRDVALKVLPKAFARDSDRLSRFKHEAQVLAVLNHPNIAAIYGFEEAIVGGAPICALVLELVEGPTLADRIAKGPIPFDEAVTIARQLAEALAAAHERRIIHCDFKPANIKLRPDGVVKVLDFGVAKSFEPDDNRDGQVEGPLLGTAAYASPEQIKGEETDRRSDVWAFGCVLYEMLSGRRAFPGNLSETARAVLGGEPDWAAIDSTTPPAVLALIHRCLEKDRRRRVADLSTALFVFEESAMGVVKSGDTSPRNKLRRFWPSVAAAAVVGALAGAAITETLKIARPNLTRPVTRFTLTLPVDEAFRVGGVMVALSPSGRELAYVIGGHLYIRALDRLTATPVADVVGYAASPFFSPDGQWVGYWDRGELKRVPVNGGAPVTICRFNAGAAGAEWSKDGTIVFGAGYSGIFRVSASGGAPDAIVAKPDGFAHRPQILPDGHTVLFTLHDGTSEKIVVQTIGTSSDRHTVVEKGSDAVYVPGGYLLYLSGDTLLAARFDATTHAIVGAPVPVAAKIVKSLRPGFQSPGQFAVSQTGSLAYFSGSFADVDPNVDSTLVWVNRAGHEEAIDAPPRSYVYPRISPDGTRLAVTVRTEAPNIWAWDFARRSLTRLTFGSEEDRGALWTADSRQIIFGSRRGGHAGIWRQSANGAGSPEQLARVDSGSYMYLVPNALTRDESRLVISANPGPSISVGEISSADLFMVSMHGAPRFEPLLKTGDQEMNAELSPDGRWLAYQSQENGHWTVYVRPFPNVDGGRWQLAMEAIQPRWSHDGRELFYGHDRSLMRVSVTPGPTWMAGTPKKLFQGAYVWSGNRYAGRQYDVSADDQRFLMLKAVPRKDPTAAGSSLTIVQNWLEDLKGL